MEVPFGFRFRFLVADLTRNEPESVTLDILHENGVGTGQEQPKSEKKFGIPSAIEILRVLTTLIDPLNRQHSDSLHRIVALELLTTVLETAGPSLSAYISWAVDKNSHRQTRPFSRKTSLVDLNKLSIKESHNTVSILETPMSPLLVDIQPHSSDEKLVKEDDQGNAASESEPIPEKIRTTRSGLIRLGLITKELLTNDLCKFVFQVGPPLFDFMSFSRNFRFSKTTACRTIPRHLGLLLSWLVRL